MALDGLIGPCGRLRGRGRGRRLVAGAAAFALKRRARAGRRHEGHAQHTQVAYELALDERHLPRARRARVADAARGFEVFEVVAFGVYGNPGVRHGGATGMLRARRPDGNLRSAPAPAPASGDRWISTRRAALAGLERKLRDADDEAALWRMRMDLATRKREPELAREARALIDRYAAVAETLRGEIAALRSARTGGTASPAAASPAAPVEDELEALRRRMAERAAAKPPPAPPEVPTAPATPEALAVPEAPAARSADDELAALKRRLLGDRPAPAPTTAPTPQAAVPSAPVSTSTPAAQAAPEEDEMAALKRKLRGK